MRKVLVIDISHVSFQSTGSAKICLEFIPKLLEKLDYVSWDVVIIENDSLILSVLKETVPVKVVFFSENLYTLINNIDVIYIPVPKNGILNFWRIINSTNYLVTQFLDFIAFKRRSYFPNFFSWIKYIILCYCYFLKSNKIIVNSSAVRVEFSKILFGKSLSKKLVESPFGVQTRSLEPVFDDEASKIILVVGTSYSHKNRIWALKIIKKLLSYDKNYKIIFPGPDPKYGHSRLEDDLYISQKMSSYAKSFAFPGWVSDEMFNLFVDSADLVLYPSLEEGFGLVPFEIYARNKVCLFGKVGVFKNPEFDNSQLSFLSLTDLDWDYNLVVNHLVNSRLRKEQIDEMHKVAIKYSPSNYIDNILSQIVAF